jgi:tetratricopeptide (TPR) repeat protein
VPPHGGGLHPGAAGQLDEITSGAVWRLRSRACWQEAAELLAPAAEQDPRAALCRAELLIEQCLFTADHWDEAEAALRIAEAGVTSTEQRAAAACARGFLAYLGSVLGPRDRLDEAQAALGRTSALLPPSATGRPLLDFRRGLVAENLLRDRTAAWIAYRRAHDGALARGDTLLASSTWRHLAALALADGDRARAREGFTASLRLREELGFMVGVAPALAALAEVSEPEEAHRLRAEAGRLVQSLGGVPVWLVGRLGDDDPGGPLGPGPVGSPAPSPPGGPPGAPLGAPPRARPGAPRGRRTS